MGRRQPGGADAPEIPVSNPGRNVWDDQIYVRQFDPISFQIPEGTFGTLIDDEWIELFKK